jgi:uncharacterized protein (DUF697 family)
MSETLAEAERQARNIINGWSAAAVGIGWIPGSMLALAAADVKIVNDVAKVFGVTNYAVEEVTAAIGASVTGKVVAGELLSFFPGLGWIVKSAVAGVITKSVGEVIVRYFKDRSSYR